MLHSKLSAAALAVVGLLAGASAANAAAALTTASLKLFDGPVAGAALVDTLPAKSRVGVLWCGMQQHWCLVSFHAKQGFVNADGLQLVGGRLAAGETGASGNAQDPGKPGRRPAEAAALAEQAAPPKSLGGSSSGGSTGGGINFQAVQSLHLVGN